MRAIDAVTAQPWAITREALRQITSISLRQNDVQAGIAEAKEIMARRDESPSAVAARQGVAVKNTRRGAQRQGVGILPLTGPIFPRANMMTEYSGGTSLSVLSQDLHAMIDDPDIKSIILDIDSPGGVAFGPAEMAELIRAGSKEKPIVAYVSGWCCSAAYWIASAATEIVAHESAALGSIGVVTAVPVQEQPDQNGEVYHEIVSGNAGNKRPDPRTEEGRAEIARELNDLESLFIGAVALYRGKSSEYVTQNFGKGGILIAADAVKVGMADRTGSFEALLSELSNGSNHLQKGEHTMSKEEAAVPAVNVSGSDVKADTASARKEGFDAGLKEGLEKGAQAERDRIAGIESVAKAGHEDLVAAAKADGKSTAADVAVKIVQAEKKSGSSGSQYLQTVQQASAALPALDPSASNAAPTMPSTQTEDPSAPIADRAKATWDSSAEIRSEFCNNFESYLGYRKGVEAGRVRSKTK